MSLDIIMDKLVSMEVLLALISSSIMATFISSVITKNVNDRTLRLKYITEERQKWRALMKEKVSLVVSNSYKDKNELLKLATEIQLSLNPNDKEDKKIISCLREIMVSSHAEREKEKLVELTQQLLKHDWERAKKEASPFRMIPKKNVRKKVSI
ncbi:hypothetical protein [Pseudoneobacillus sp. C159]